MSESATFFARHSDIYPSQTKIWEGGTKDEIQIFEALFKGVSTRFGLRTIEKSVENLDFIFCQTFQNLRLGSITLATHWRAKEPYSLAIPNEHFGRSDEQNRHISECLFEARFNAL